jgi:thioesterase domain-containing protein
MALAGIWAELLKVERVGRRDNFFDLGGHSLLAIRVLNLARHAGIDLQVTDLFTNSDLASLAASIIDKSKSSESEKAIPLQINGSGIPLFLLHDGLGEINYASRLAANIDSTIPVYVLPCVPAEQKQLDTMRDMAKRMIRMIRRIQPLGPYRISGWSFGGMLAYEIAAQLFEENEAVEFLGLIDTNYFKGMSASEDTVFDENACLLRRIESKANHDATHRKIMRDLKNASASIDLQTLIRKCKESSILPDSEPIEAIRRLLIRDHLFFNCAINYVARPIAIRAYLFWATEEEEIDSMRGWSAVFPADMINTIPIRGNHFTMMQPPNVEYLGREISNAILTVE